MAIDEHVEIDSHWGIYERIIAVYRHPDKVLGISSALAELSWLGLTLRGRTTDVLAFFDRPETFDGQADAIKGRLEHLCGPALGCRNLTNYNHKKPPQVWPLQTRLRAGATS